MATLTSLAVMAFWSRLGQTVRMVECLVAFLAVG